MGGASNTVRAIGSAIASPIVAPVVATQEASKLVSRQDVSKKPEFQGPTPEERLAADKRQREQDRLKQLLKSRKDLVTLLTEQPGRKQTQLTQRVNKGSE